MVQEITGRHVAAMFGAAFSVIIGVNVLLATKAISTFPGLEVKNSYVASQTFDADRASQEALGWTVDARIEDGRLRLAFADRIRAIEPIITKALLGRATHVNEDRTPDFRFDGTAFVAGVPDLGPGKWTLRLEAVATDGTVFRKLLHLEVAG
ncbi:nitrogen fixation protein FixH [Silicimonas algicola]|uniref:Nitrogen fixation protein FixH n=1 Tax=Silicimonas algicola TaxID=1826607 RepID=A0A316G3Z0_9RHOB|nr:FixH family protein [Silicimonas algicola]AZQ68623.1 nitrogen fixation protein FixH [Silicimonas algicola]PWK55654.1 nitrogen fixation protein FixH [Silicimonas algicola]